MKKIVLLFLLVSSTYALKSQEKDDKKQLEDGFNYSSVTTITWTSTLTMCVNVTCTSNKGDDCTVPNSSMRSCL